MKRKCIQLIILFSISNAMAQDNLWRQDLGKLYDLVIANSGHIFQNYDYNAWNEDYNNLLDNINGISQNEIRVKAMELIAKLKDGHSGIWIRDIVIPNKNTEWFPLRLYYFKEGLFIVSSSKEYETLIGSKIERIGDISEKEASDLVFKITNGENKYNLLDKAPFMITFPPILKGLGIIDDIENLPLTVRLADGSFKDVNIRSVNYSEGVGGFFERFRAPSKESVRLDEVLGITWPDSKWSTELPYFLEYIKEKQTVYFKINTFRDPPGYSLDQFYQSLSVMLETKLVNKLIVDVRNNGGGNLNKAWPFVFIANQHPEINQKNKLIILTGRKTFSAATAFVSMLETHTNAVFVGEPSGGRPNQTEGTPIFPPPVLDHLGVDVLLSRGRWTHTNPLDNREYIMPDIFIAESIEDWKKGIDRVFVQALELN